MKNLAKKLLVFCLALTMALSLCPVSGVFAAVEITGDEAILLPPAGATTRIEYTLSGASIDNVVWSAVDAPEGITMMPDGGLLVEGSTTRGKSFSIQAKTSTGALLAEKTLKITAAGDHYYWTDNKVFFVDYEVYTVGARLNHKQNLSGNTGWDDALLMTPVWDGANDSIPNFGKIVAEANGNKYLYAYGNSGNLIVAEFNPQKYNGQTSLGGNWLSDANTLTFEADFLITDEIVATMEADTEYILFSKGTNIKFVYKKLDASTLGIYEKMTTEESVLLCTAPIGSWFTAGFTFNRDTQLVDFYYNDKRIAKNLPSNGLTTLNGAYITIGAPIDNIACYSGTPTAYYLPGSFPETLYFTPSYPEAAVPVEKNVFFGVYPQAAVVNYSGADTRVDGNMLYVADGEGDVTLRMQNAQYDMDEVVTIKRADGVEYNFNDGQTGISGGSAMIFGGMLNTLMGNAEYALDNMVGNLMITYDNQVGGTAKLSTTGGDTIIDFGSGAGNAAVVIIADTKAGTYKAYLGTALVAEGALASGALTGLTLNGCMIDNLTISSVAPVAPYALTPAISGVYAVDQALTASYTYDSPWSAPKKSATVTWYAADTEAGSYTSVGTGETWIPGDDIANKYVKYAITVSDGVCESQEVYSPAVLVKPVVDLSVAENNLTATILNMGSDLYAAVQLYNGGVLEKVLLEDIVMSGESYTFTKDITGYDGAAVVLVNKDTLVAASSRKSIGTVPAEVGSAAGAAKGNYAKNGYLYLSGDKNDMLTVLIYNHATDAADLTVSYSDVYERDDIFAAIGDESLSEKLVYATTISLDSNGQAALKLPALTDGTYRADIINKAGLEKECLFMDSPEAMINPNGMILPGFANVMKLYSDKEDSVVDLMFEYCSSLSPEGRGHVTKLLAGKDYNMEWIDLSACLVRYFESVSFDQVLYNHLLSELRDAGLETKGVVMMKHDAKPNETGQLILSGSWSTYEQLLAPLYEKAILYGILHVKNYMEADVYLDELTDTIYADSPYQANICDMVSGKLYSSIADLKAAVNGYQHVTGGNSGSLSTGTGGGNKGGSSFGGGSVLQPGKEIETAKPMFTDVAAGHWAEEAIGYLSEMNIITGRPGGIFAPEDTITRAEFIKILCTAFELSSKEKASFDDVESSAWYAPYVSVAGALGIAQGSDGCFRPNDTLTREDAAVLLQRVLVMQGKELTAGDAVLPDQSEIADYAEEAVRQLHAAGYINGMSDGSFCPKNLLTRAQCAQIIAKALRGGSEV